MKIEKEFVYKVDDLAKVLRIGKRTVQEMLREGAIKAKNVGTEKRAIFLVQGKDLLEYLNK